MLEYTVKVYQSGAKSWWLNGQRHREDGPAIEMSKGNKEWYLNGKLHREDGPAIERSNGNKEWWVNGREVTEQEVMGKSLIGKTVTIDGVKYVLGEY